MKKFDTTGIEKLIHTNDYPALGLSVVKYGRAVFYDNLWNTDSRLLDARGIVVDQSGNIVAWPFTKVFNYGENNTLPDLDQVVQGIEKINGFMLTATNHNGKVLFSSTGSLHSDHVELGKVVVNRHKDDFNFYPGISYIFEICDPTDVHIVDEQPGAYLIGARYLSTGRMMSEIELDLIAHGSGFFRPERETNTVRYFVDKSKTAKHEGFMIRDLNDNTLCKIKSTAYLSKKAIIRLGNAKIDDLFTKGPENIKRRIDEEFFGVVDHICASFTKETWKELTGEQRKLVIDNYFKEV